MSKFTARYTITVCGFEVQETDEPQAFALCLKERLKDNLKDSELMLSVDVSVLKGDQTEKCNEILNASKSADMALHLDSFDEDGNQTKSSTERVEY